MKTYSCNPFMIFNLKCALENLVRARVSKTNVIQVSRPHGLTKGAEYSLRLDLAGLGATSALSAHSSGSYESVIEIGDSQADDAQLRRICEAINDLIFEYSGADPSSSRLESGVYNEYSITTNRHVFSNGTATREAVNTSGASTASSKFLQQSIRSILTHCVLLFKHLFFFISDALFKRMCNLFDKTVKLCSISMSAYAKLFTLCSSVDSLSNL